MCECYTALRHVESLVMTVSAAGKCTRPLTFAELTPFVHAGHWSWASKTVTLNRLLNKRWNLTTMTLRTGLTRPPQPLCESETAGTRGGQKCGVITQSTAHSDPLSGLTETGQAPTIRTCVGTRPPGGSSRQLRNVRIEIRQGLQLEGEFQPSSVLSSACLVFASQRFLSASAVIPASCFHIVLAQGRGVTQAATSEHDGKLIINTGRNNGKNLNYTGVEQGKQVRWRESLLTASVLITMSSRVGEWNWAASSFFWTLQVFISNCVSAVLKIKCPKWKCQCCLSMAGKTKRCLQEAAIFWTPSLGCSLSGTF